MSDTTLTHVHCLRAAIVNHRTRGEDVEIVIDAYAAIPAKVARERIGPDVPVPTE